MTGRIGPPATNRPLLLTRTYALVAQIPIAQAERERISNCGAAIIELRQQSVAQTSAATLRRREITQGKQLADKSAGPHGTTRRLLAGNLGTAAFFPSPEEGASFPAPSNIPEDLQCYIAFAIWQELGRPQEAHQGPPSHSLVLDEQAMEEDRMVWQQLASHP